MRKVKRELPKGVRYKFETRIGKKIKVINTLYLKDNKKKKAK